MRGGELISVCVWGGGGTCVWVGGQGCVLFPHFPTCTRYSPARPHLDATARPGHTYTVCGGCTWTLAQHNHVAVTVAQLALVASPPPPTLQIIF